MKRNAQRYGSLVLALAALCTTDLSARTTFSTITDVASVSQAASTNKPCQQEAKAPQLGIDPLQDVIDAMTIEEKVYLLVGAGTSATDLEAAIIGQTRKLVPGAAGTYRSDLLCDPIPHRDSISCNMGYFYGSPCRQCHRQ